MPPLFPPSGGSMGAVSADCVEEGPSHVLHQSLGVHACGPQEVVRGWPRHACSSTSPLSSSLASALAHGRRAVATACRAAPYDLVVARRAAPSSPALISRSRRVLVQSLRTDGRAAPPGPVSTLMVSPNMAWTSTLPHEPGCRAASPDAALLPRAPDQSVEMPSASVSSTCVAGRCGRGICAVTPCLETECCDLPLLHAHRPHSRPVVSWEQREKLAVRSICALQDSPS